MSEIEYSTYGRHVLADLYGVDWKILNDLTAIHELLEESCNVSGATIIGKQVHKFNPQGLTALFMLSESHISIHTYPEHGYCSIDCYTCGEMVDPSVAVDYLISKLTPSKVIVKNVLRGYLPPD